MLLVVGGHSRNIGKTSVMEGIIRALPDARWTAVKITQHGHGICSSEGEPCQCAEMRAHPFAIDEEREPNDTDSGRYLRAGAQRSFWVRTAQNDLGHAMPALRRLLASSPNTIVESNSILGFVVPDLYLAVLDPAVADMKDSQRRFLDRADALLWINRGRARSPWHGIPDRWLAGRKWFSIAPPDYAPPELVTFIASRLSTADRRTRHSSPSD